MFLCEYGLVIKFQLIRLPVPDVIDNSGRITQTSTVVSFVWVLHLNT